ncbi:glycosyltransferase [Halosquirtibacter laminarini]|uniref:Glycosyltransferase n=1 Tax=Halosquirtibacter laminarini TaxID=3374600 RepID=A0AC61ND36_9BACT|nr:glycosyltransferase [Prolixibacteraceae bacterium]
MKVSIITATYNSSSKVKDAIQSVNDQTYQDIEHVFIDGGSSDNTLELINSISTRKRTILSEPDNGIYDALNKGILMSSGDLIGFVHSDDFLAHPDTISRIVHTIRKSDYDGVYGDLEYIDSSNSSKSIRVWRSCCFSPRLLNRGWMPAHPTFFIKKSVYDQMGLFDIGYRISGDYDFMVRILTSNRYQFGYLSEVISKMRVGGISNRSLKSIIRKSKEDYSIMKQNRFRFPLFVLLNKNISKIPQYFRACQRK